MYILYTETLTKIQMYVFSLVGLYVAYTECTFLSELYTIGILAFWKAKR